ncbi:MAG: ATP-binding cassette domain-containing protein [Dehalococcoidia bacterium]|nr:ATP-binding cassette domain-containing protein [Dehalococcoidia bacterium]
MNESPNPTASVTDARPVLAVSGLRVRYRTEEETIPAVRDVSLDLFPGEVLAVVGESGSGKSSVAHAILGLLPANAKLEAGTVSFRGRSLLDMPRNQLQQVRGEEIAMIFQDAQSALTPTLRVGEQLAELFESHRGASEDDARKAAVDVLKGLLADPLRVADAYPFQLSGGMAQRVMIGMATALDPSVIIADEPTANLDPAVRHETLSTLEGLRDQEDVSVLLITHDFGVVARLADRVAVMYAGEIVETADVRSIFRWPRHPYTFGLLQSLPDMHRPGRMATMPGHAPDLATLPPECPFLPRCNKATSQCRTEPAPRLMPVEGSDGEHMVACYNPIAVSLRGD